MYIRIFALFGALSLFSGCAIHPLPEDVANTYHIVRQIRCETRETLKNFVITWLNYLGSDHEGSRGILSLESSPSNTKVTPSPLAPLTPISFLDPGTSRCGTSSIYSTTQG
jgi:hypothetical protein